MSRVANNPIKIPTGVDVAIKDEEILIKGPKGHASYALQEQVEVSRENNQINIKPRNKTKFANALAGTTRANINNLVHGVTYYFEKKLTLHGVGYRAQTQGKKLNLALGFSHPVLYETPEGITIETPSVTEIIIKGINKQTVGQVAAEIRSLRPPEVYKGKGIRYADEKIELKEIKKK